MLISIGMSCFRIPFVMSYCLTCHAPANPIGGAIGQLLSPAFPDTRQGILVLGIISTAAAPLALLVWDKPPTPPSTLCFTYITISPR